MYGTCVRESSAGASRDQGKPPTGALLQRFSPRQPVESESPRISALSAREEALPNFRNQAQLSNSYNNNADVRIPNLDLNNFNGNGQQAAHSLDTGMALNAHPTKPPRVKSGKKDKRAKKIPKVGGGVCVVAINEWYWYNIYDVCSAHDTALVVLYG